MSTSPETTYQMGDRTYTRDELRAKVEAEAAGLDPEQWMFGKFEFDEWLSDSIVVGTVTKV
jgi:phosphodiesterase/alkaline phosphatase D-like protein